MSRRILAATLSLFILAGCGHSATQPGNQTAEAPANTISTIDENAADASLANIVDVTPGDNDTLPTEANGQ
jgi:PBP1b-binding outer membrane lipoprotein LpoB